MYATNPGKCGDRWKPIYKLLMNSQNIGFIIISIEKIHQFYGNGGCRMAFVEFQHVGKTYGSGPAKVEALRDVSFEVEQGELCVIVGHSGAGKTTLLNILGGMDTLTDGKVLLDGQEVSAFKKRQLTTYRRQDVGFVFQFSKLIGAFSVIDDVRNER